MTDSKLLEGKKLLLLGGAGDMVNVTRLAQSMGCKVYVVDYYDTDRSPAKLVADEYSNISIADYDELAEYIKSNGIDGVMTGFTDSYLQHYLNVCEKAGLPHYGSKEAFGVATDKMLFKQACKKCGVPVIPGTNAFSFDEVKAFAAENTYPLMLKPADNSGSRGVIKCESAENLQECYEYALSFSPTNNVIVEKYMDCDSVGIVYQFAGDEAKLVAMCDRDTYHAEESGSGVITGTRYPSEYLDRYVEEVDEAMKRLFKEYGFRDGMVSPMAFVDADGFYMCEMCYRPSGGHHYVLINDQNDVNGLALLIEFAVTGKTESYAPEKETPYFKEYCGMIHIIGVPDKKVAEISGVEEIERLPGVIEYVQDIAEGHVVGADGTSAQVLASVWLKAKNREEYEATIKKIKSVLNICDSEGNSLIKE